MSAFRRSATLILVAATLASAQLIPIDGDRGRLGLGYDEGIAARFFFTDILGAQLSVGFEHLGGYDAYTVDGNQIHGAREDQTDWSIGGAFIVSILGTRWVYADALAQIAYAHDDTGDPDDLGDRGMVFFRVALAPEILIGDHVGLGFRLGTELVYIGDTKTQDGGTIYETDDSRVNFRLYGPRNPFSGSTLGMSLFVYFGRL